MKAIFKFETSADVIDYFARNILHDQTKVNDLKWEEWKQTFEVMHSGWSEGASVVNEILQEVVLNDQLTTIQRNYNQSVTGLSFDVGLVCSNIPECWLEAEPRDNSIITSIDRNPIKLGLNAVTVNHSSESIIERGSALIALGSILEKSGWPVSFTQYYSLPINNITFEGIMVHKSFDEPLDANLLSSWVSYPNFVYQGWKEIAQLVYNVTASDCVYKEPNGDYGKEHSDIFLSGTKLDRQWTRTDSINWICDEVEKLVIEA